MPQPAAHTCPAAVDWIIQYDPPDDPRKISRIRHAASNQLECSADSVQLLQQPFMVALHGVGEWQRSLLAAVARARQLSSTVKKRAGQLFLGFWATPEAPRAKAKAVQHWCHV